PGEEVKFSGEAVAMVVAERRAEAVDAAELVEGDYDPPPAILDPEGAAAGGPYVHAEAGTNIANGATHGEPETVLDGCEVVVEARIVNSRVAACPLEGRGAAAMWSADGGLTFWISTQGAHSVRDTLCPILGLDKDAVRVIAPDVGGGFGIKIGLNPEELLVAWAARRLG